MKRALRVLGQLLRGLLRPFVFAMTAGMMGLGHGFGALGGKPKIKDPDPKNPVVDMVKKK